MYQKLINHVDVFEICYTRILDTYCYRLFTAARTGL